MAKMSKGVIVEFDFTVLNGAEILFDTAKKLLKGAGVELNARLEALHLAGGNYQGGLAELFEATGHSGDAAALAAAIGDDRVVAYAETSSTYGSCKWDVWKRACRLNGLHEMLVSAVTGSGFGVRAALVAGMSALGVTNERVAWQDFGGADKVVETLDKKAAEAVLQMLKVS